MNTLGDRLGIKEFQVQMTSLLGGFLYRTLPFPPFKHYPVLVSWSFVSWR
jgi:hypothetical protein